MEYFEKVIGYADIKFELARIIDIMNHPAKYAKLGVAVPSGVMLCGMPGVGKTLLANEFIRASGRRSFLCRKDQPDGAFIKQIRHTFEEAKAVAPSIVFLDDMDKFSSSEERRSDAEEYVTIQSCMDDVKNQNVFVIATANKLWKFPTSLHRRSRFDRRFEMAPPSGKDAVETVINQAGLYAGYAGKDQIEMDDMIQACLCEIYDKPEHHSGKNPQNQARAAYHEAGHAVLTEVLNHGSIVLVSLHNSTGSIGGVTSVYHNEDDDTISKEAVEKRIICLLGGKAAVEIAFGDRIQLEDIA